MNINAIVSFLAKKYGTRNPFELADYLNIEVLYEELGAINGYYNKQLRMKQIHINCNLEDNMKRFTCAHELGHAIIHPEVNTPFLKTQTFLSVNRLEIEANTFAINMLIPDETVLENYHYTTEQLSRLLGYAIPLIELRLKSYREM